MAFRGMKARFMVFQLAFSDATALWPSHTSPAVLHGISNGAQITIRVADETGSPRASAGSAQDHALIKVHHCHEILFSFWMPRATANTLQTIIWKFWRYNVEMVGFEGVRDVEIWTDLSSSGDSLLAGCYRAHTDRLSGYLNTNHCHGKLEEEPLCVEHGTSGSAFNPAQPLVLKVNLAIRRTHRNRQDSRLTRLDVLKQMFEAYINRTTAYGYKTHMGLVTFDTAASVKTSLTHVVENFRRSTSTMAASGDTSLWDALALCRDQLNEYSKKYPGVKKRIIVISDGEDTKSESKNPGGLTFDLRNDKIIVDSGALGNQNSLDLRMLS